MILLLVYLAVLGFIVGGLARFALPGPDPMGVFATILLGLAGSFAGGLLGWLIFGRPGGFILSVIAATILLAIYRKYVQHRPLTGPGAHRLPPR